MTGHPAASGVLPVAALAGGLIVAGIWAVGSALYGDTRPRRNLALAVRAVTDRTRRRLRGLGAGADGVVNRGTGQRSARTRVLLAAAAGMGVWWVTGWPVAGLIAAAAVAGLPPLLTTSVASAGRITRLEALEDWTRRLADVLTVGVGLEQAITASLRTTPAAIAPQVAALAARLGARWPTEAALRAFADDLDDATGDLVAAALILGSRRRGPGLGAVLDGLAGTVAEEVAMRRKVEADRARPRTTARWVTLITVGVVGLGALNGTYIRPYGSGLGQLVLASLALAFAGVLVWMRAISAGTPEPRFLPGPGEAGTR